MIKEITVPNCFYNLSDGVNNGKQNNVLDYTFFINVLTFLFELSEILRNRINQKEIVH